MIARATRRDATFTSAVSPARVSAVCWLVGALGAAVMGCGNSAPHGPPVLQQVYWETRGGVQTLAWSSIPADADIPKVVSPVATQFDLVLDRVIDGSKVEVTITDGGISIQRPQPTEKSPVLVYWQDMGAAGSPTFSLSVWYNSLHLPIAPVNTAYVYGRELPSYPSNTSISICIDPTKITSEYGEPMAPLPADMSKDCPVSSPAGAPMVAITVKTALFAVGINAPPVIADTAPTPADAGASAPIYVPTNFQIPLQFDNIPVDVKTFATGLPQYLDVRQNGQPLAAGEYQLQASPSDPTLILLEPGSIGVWASGGQLDVTLSADLPDIYGATLGVAQSASFIPCQLVGQDGGTRICAPPIHPDGGASDGGAGDTGASDAGATDAGDASVVIDAPVDSDDAADAPVDAATD